MFDTDSRYYALPTRERQVKNPDGTTTTVRYVTRRRLPDPDGGVTVVRHSVLEGQRLDHIAVFYGLDPKQFWRIADANRVLDPSELTSSIGRLVRISMQLP